MQHIINYEKKGILPLAYQGIESYNKKFCHIYRKKFCDVNDRDDNSNVNIDGEGFDARKIDGDDVELDDVDDCYDDDSSDEEFDARKFPGDAMGFDIDDEYYDQDDGDDNNYEFDAGKFHGDAAGLDDVDDYEDDLFEIMRFDGVSKNYERISDHCH